MIVFSPPFRPVVLSLVAAGLLVACATRPSAPETAATTTPSATPAPMPDGPIPVPEPAPEPAPPPLSRALSPAASLATVQLQPGYHLQPVLTEPDIAEPVMIAFDGNGRMFVAEMRTYMQDADATGEFERVSRVSMHEDTDGDGVYDRHTVFADHLLLPRILLPLDDRIIIGETNTDDLYIYRDTDGDGVADEKTLWFQGGQRGGNMEHQPNGLVWALDNGIYSTYYDYRLRFAADGSAIKEAIPVNGGQWGLTQDDWGKVWFVNAGNELGPVHFQQPILYGQFSVADELRGDFKTVWPIDNIPDTQGGRNQLRADNTLNHFTATCGQAIFRGDRLPADLQGDLLFGEPVGRLVRRTKITVEDGVTRLRNPYEAEHGEFIRATDPLFRPMNMTTAPDGTLYVVDMYRGIIQEGAWTRKGSYLREQIDAYNLDREIGRGRIYRLVHDDFQPGPTPHMLDETPAQWVTYLSHPNGWWRDTAQKLLVLKRDLSVVPALEHLARVVVGDQRPRVHALWTLDGLGALDPRLIEGALSDSHWQVRVQGLRLAESRLGPDTPSDSLFLRKVTSRLADPEPSVVIQAMLSLRRVFGEQAKEMIAAAANASSSAGVYTISEALWSEANTEDPFLLSQLGAPGLKSYRAGRTFYDSLCFACHGTDGRGAPATPGKTIAPPLAGSAHVLGDERAAIAIVLHGLIGELHGIDYGAPMVPMNSYPDQQLADVLTYIRNSFGNRAPVVTAEAVAARRAADADHANFWTPAELAEAFPALQVPRQPFSRRAEWKLTTNAPAAPETPLGAAIDGDPATGYASQGATPYPDQWITIELPAPSQILGLQMDATDEPKSWAPAYRVEVSDEGQTWRLIADALGEPNARLNLPAPVTARFVRITLTEKHGWQKWAIRELQLYGQEG